MLFNTTQRATQGKTSGTKLSLVLLALVGGLLWGTTANSEEYDSRDYRTRSISYDRLSGYDRDHADYLGTRGDGRLDKPSYGDLRGDRYSPEPASDYSNLDRLSRRELDRLQQQLDDLRGEDRRLDSPSRRNEHTTRRLPLPDLDRDRYSLPNRDDRYNDNHYDPYEAPRLREDERSRWSLPLDRNEWNNSVPQPNYNQPTVRPEDQLSDVEQIQQHLTARYGNPVVQRFLYNVTPEQTLTLYREASQLIDARHLEPTSYQVRTQRAAANLIQGLRNQAFLAANRISPSATQVRNFENAMTQLLQSRPVRNQNEAVQMVYAMANLAHQQAGIRPTTVVLEFTYGSAESLDKYSTFIPEETSRQPSASALDGSVVGIGVEIKPHDDGIEVIKTLRGGPAEAGGLRPGDVIVGINGKSLRGQSLDFAVDQIGGPVGSPVYLSVVRDGRAATPITLTRREVKIQSVSEVKMMGRQNDVGYVKLDKFAQSSTAEMDQALWSLHRAGMQSLIIDLRGNPGGLLTTAIELSDKFLPSGTIVSTRGRTTADRMTEQAQNAQTWKVPLVVLIDGDSASASEIFAAAIQDNGRGVIVGRRSYGKGTVQTHFPLRSVGGNLKLTTAKFYSPKGREMADAGVVPDVQVTATSYRGTAGSQDQDIETAVSVAESNRVRDNLAINRP